MNKIGRIIVWAMLSIMMQIAGLLYLDKVLFKHSSEFKVVQVEKTNLNKEITYDFPENATEINVSDDGRYITYFQENALMLLDTKSMDTREILTGDGSQILYCDWILDENILITGEVVYKSSYSSIIRISTYNVRTDFETTMVDLCPYEEGMKIDTIASSMGTGTHYVGVSRDGYNSNIYRIDINFDFTRVSYKLPSLGAMKAIEDYDVLLYEDSLNKSFYYYTNGTSSKIHIENSNNMVLIGVDNDKNVYMGELEDEKVSRILYGKYDEDPTTWKTLQLEKPKDISDITITENSELLINDNLTGKITNLNTNEVIEYDGKLLQITKEIICSIDDNKIIFKTLEEVDN